MDPIQYRGTELLIMALTVPLLVYVGYKLFVLGVTGKMQITAGFAKQWTARLTSVAPGTICFLFATILAVFIIKQALRERPAAAVEAVSPCTNEVKPSPTGSTGKKLSNEAAKPVKALGIAIDFVGGQAKDALSARLEKGLSDYCPVGQNATRTCSVEFYEHFNQQPSPADIAHIKEIERKAKTGNAAAKNNLQGLTQDYLKQ